jgi:hypothetical protein
MTYMMLLRWPWKGDICELAGNPVACVEASSKALVRLISGVEQLGWILYGSDDFVALLGLGAGF